MQYNGKLHRLKRITFLNWKLEKENESNYNFSAASQKGPLVRHSSLQSRKEPVQVMSFLFKQFLHYLWLLKWQSLGNLVVTIRQISATFEP